MIIVSTNKNLNKTRKNMIVKNETMKRMNSEYVELLSKLVEKGFGRGVDIRVDNTFLDVYFTVKDSRENEISVLATLAYDGDYEMYRDYKVQLMDRFDSVTPNSLQAEAIRLYNYLLTDKAVISAIKISSTQYHNRVVNKLCEKRVVNSK